MRSAGVLPLLLAASCAQAPWARGDAEAEGDPRQVETLLEGAAEGWDAVLVHDNGGTGTWTVGAADVSDAWGGDEVVALDDVGICLLLVPYSGRWTAMPSVHDGKWLGALDGDETRPEIAVTGYDGKVWILVQDEAGAWSATLLFEEPERNHWLDAGELDGRNTTRELLFSGYGGRTVMLRRRP